MKKVKNMKTKRTFIVSFLLIVAIAGAAVTIALAVAQSTPVTNTFTAADHNTNIDENVEGNLTKEVRVQNSASNSPAFIRVRLTPSPEGSVNLIFAEDAFATDKWVNGGDGFYYYLQAVEPGNSTDMLLKAVEPVGDITTFDVTVYEESCVATQIPSGTDALTHIKATFNASTGTN